MEIIIAKLWSVIQSHMSLIGGTALHFLFTAKLDQNKIDVPKKTITGVLITILISVLMGKFFEVVVVGYYSWDDKEATIEIIRWARVSGAVIGFAGTVLAAKLVVILYNKSIDPALEWAFGKKTIKQNSRRNKYERNEEYSDHEDS